MRRTITLGACLALCVAVAVSFVRAEDQPKKPSPEEMAKMMEAMQKLAQPNENHKKLEAMAGEFKAECKFMGMGEPQVSEGTTKNEMILGGRFLQCSYAGTWMGKPFKGLQLLGYDNQKQKYTGMWADEMATTMMLAEGEADSTGKVITLRAEFNDPVSNKPIKARMVTTVVDKDTHKWEMYCTGMTADGSEKKNMEITYTRVK